jgi:autotransporter-associated beta strand protein
MKHLPNSTGRSALALALFVSIITTASGADFFFNQTNSGDFAVAANWQGGNLPSGFGNTFIGSSDLGSPPLAPVTAYLSSDVTSLETGALFLGQGGSGNATLVISNGGSLQYGLVYIGRDGGAVGVIDQLGGTNRVNTGTFEILSGSSGTGTYNLSGGVLNTIQAGAIAIQVGASGSGTGYFNMSGGTFNAGSDFSTQQHSLNVGWGAKGEATFSGGTANLTGDLNAGNGSNGLVTISGTALVNARSVNVGLNAGAANSRLTVSGGTLSVTNSIDVDNTSEFVLVGGSVSAPALNIEASGTVTNSGATINITAITNNGTLIFARTADYTNASVISGGGTIVKQGTNTALTLAGTNSFTNGMQVWEGAVAFGDPASLGAGLFRVGRLTTTGTLRFTGASNSTVTNDIQIGFGAGPSDGGAVLDAVGAGAATFSSLVAEPGAQAARTLTLTGTNTGSNTISGAIADNNTANGAWVSLVKTGPGTWILAGNNTYSGNTTVNAGKLELAAGGSLSFVIGGNGTNSALAGTATTVMGGQFAFDLTGAATDTNAAWTIVAGTLTNSYGTNFLVAGFSGVNGGNWTNTTNGVNYVFSQPTGILSVQAAPTNSYTSWVAYWQGVDPGFTNTAGTDNPDGDPFDNNMEFAFDGNPTIGTGALLTAVKVGTNAVFNYVAMTNTNAVTYVVQSTASLTNGWTNASVVISNSLNQTNPVISQTNIYQRKEFVVPATSNNFYRVRAIF